MWGQPPSAVRRAKPDCSLVTVRTAGLRPVGQPRAAVPTQDKVKSKSREDAVKPLPDTGSPRFSQAVNNLRSQVSVQGRERKCAWGGEFSGSCASACTKSGHLPVDGLHSIENTCTYIPVFFIDEKYRRSRTGSFFDSFLSFSGWCGVRGSSRVTVLIARLERRASKGL